MWQDRKEQSVDMDSHAPSASTHRDDRLVVCCLESDAVQAANRTREDVFRQVVTTNREATPPPRITDMVSVHDREAKAFHMLLVHRLDYRPQGASAVGDVVVFSDPTYAVFRTERLQLATPAYYRGKESLKPGIRDVRDGTLGSLRREVRLHGGSQDSRSQRLCHVARH